MVTTKNLSARFSEFSLSLAPRKRCDFENADTLRFEIAHPIIAVIFISERLGTFDLSLLFQSQKTLDFAISKRSDL